jgi:hypothetical protein
MKKHLRNLGLILVGLATIGITAAYIWHSHLARVREESYQSTLRSVSLDLRPGTTRKRVEQYVQSRGAKLERVCCIGHQPFQDVMLIGREEKPWYCGQHNVYLEFDFGSAEYTLSDTDPLRSISIVHKLDDCL